MAHTEINLAPNESAIKLVRFFGRKHVPVVLQSEITECGLACIGMIANFYGLKTDLMFLRQRYCVSMVGMTLNQMIKISGELGLAGRALRCSVTESKDLKLPCILHWDMSHFVVLTSIANGKYYINDPACGRKAISTDEFKKRFTGVALELTPLANFKKQDLRNKMKINQLWESINGVKRSLFMLLLLTIVIQAFGLASPYYTQLVVDDVLLTHDNSLLTVLALGFGFLLLFNIVASSLRSYLVLRISSLFNLQLNMNVLHHLLKLPIVFFEKRHAGDIISRFGSISPIREQITTGIVGFLVDGAMTIMTFIMMFVYSEKLALVASVSCILYLLAKLLVYSPLKFATEESINMQAEESSFFLETIQSMQTIKVYGKEQQRLSQWLDYHVNSINSDIRVSKLGIYTSTFNSILFGVENIIIIYLGAVSVMSESLTVGMLFAFISYKNQFTSALCNVISSLLQFRMLRLHLDRISDIAMHEQEDNIEGFIEPVNIKGQLTLDNVSFRYDAQSPYLIKDVNITLSFGESVAFVGSSGCGKTTLVKLMLGLLQPSKGRILFDGVDIVNIGLVRYRSYISSALQNDVPLTGTVIENITFFDGEPNLYRVEQSAMLACIHDEIMAMPMGYNTIIGSMGNVFSTGQAQRILLARALYQDPKILFLDEVTSNLDSLSEMKVNESINNLKMTKIIITHSAETMLSVDRLFMFDSGGLVQLNKPS